MSNPYKEGSRKREIYDAFLKAGGGDKGLKKAEAKAKDLGIKPGTVRSWSGGWLKGQTKPVRKDGAEPVRKRERLEEPKPVNVFRFATRADATKAMEATLERNGLRPHALRVIEQDGRYDYAPIIKSDEPIPQFKKGDVVFDLFKRNSKAKVIEAGPEQSIIKYERDPIQTGLARPREDCVSNRCLILFDAIEKKAAPARKRERLDDDEPKRKTRERL